MTQMTLMTLNPGYGIGISSKQRHYRHARILPGVWGTPQKCVCGYPNAMLAKHVCPKRQQSNRTPIQIRTFSRGNRPLNHQNIWLIGVNQCLINFDYKSGNFQKSSQYPQSESHLIHSKILTRKNESVLIHAAIRTRVAEQRKIARLRTFPVQNSLRSGHKQHGCFPEKSV